MRMSELSGRSGVPIPTIRFYLREGMLAAGELTSPNQGSYDESHVRRLKLIRALIDIGGLSVAGARAVLDHLDSGDDGDGPGELATLGVVQFALTARRDPTADEAVRTATEMVEQLLERHGWQVCGANPARDSLVDVVAVLSRLGQHDVLGLLDGYARAAQELAEREVRLVQDRQAIEDRAEGVVMVSVLGDALLAALRRLAQENLIAARLAPGRDVALTAPH